jgi:RNA polymerase sigma factor (sigma-70 family)
LPSEKNIFNEAVLWDGIKAGDRSAFAQIYDQHLKALYNFANKICQDSLLIEDAIHDLFVDLWKYRENLSSTISVRAYLYASLRRRIVKLDNQNSNILRYDHKWEELNMVSFSQESEITEKETKDEQIKKLKAHLNNLSPRQYEAIILRFYDELSYEEIALIMEVNEQSVRNLIQRGLSHLRQFSGLVMSLFPMICYLLK